MQLPDSFNGRQQQVYVNMRTGKLWQIHEFLDATAGLVMSGINANLLLPLDNTHGGDQCGSNQTSVGRGNDDEWFS